MYARRRRTNSSSEDKENSAATARTTVEATSEAPPVSASRNPSPDMTSCRDRTGEFLNTVKQMQARQGNGTIPKKSQRVQQRSEFMHHARKIGKDIASTFTKLEKLTLLARKKSLFDDKPVEIEELTYIIKQDIGSLNRQIAQLQELVKSQRHSNGRHKQSHSNTVVVALQSKLASMSNDFKSVLEIRTENMKHQSQRRGEFTNNTPVNSSMPPSALAGHAGSILIKDEANYANGGGGEVAIDMDAVDRQRLMQQQQLIEENDSYLQSRADTMQSIESTIVELGSIFQQLATMVKEQEEQVTRIDANVDEVGLNVEAAHSELLKYFQSVTSNRWLMLKVFGVLIVFFIVFVVVMA